MKWSYAASVVPFAVLATLAIFLSGCTSPVSRSDALEAVEMNGIEDDEPIDSISESISVSPENQTGCAEGWFCATEELRAYRLGNCTVTELQQCSLGCEEGACKSPEICSSGYKCRTDSRRGYQTVHCRWTEEEECPFGCVDGTCSPMPENYTAEEEEDVEEQAPGVPSSMDIRTLRIGEEEVIVVGNANYTVGIVLVEQGRVLLEINGDRADWAMQGDNVTYQELVITIEEILFQSYGNTKQIGYTLH